MFMEKISTPEQEVTSEFLHSLLNEQKRDLQKEMELKGYRDILNAENSQ